MSLRDQLLTADTPAEIATVMDAWADNDYATRPAVGDPSKIYLDKSTGLLYRWNAATLAYVQATNGSVLSTTTLRMAADTVVASGAAIPFGIAVRDDKLVTSGTTLGAINLPIGVTQFRFSYHVNVNSVAGVVTYRRVTPAIITGANAQDEALLGVLPVNVHSPILTTSADTQVLTTNAAHFTLIYQSPWIDIADLTVAPSGVADEDAVSVLLQHNAGVGNLSVVAGSSFTLETITPT